MVLAAQDALTTALHVTSAIGTLISSLTAFAVVSDLRAPRAAAVSGGDHTG